MEVFFRNHRWALMFSVFLATSLAVMAQESTDPTAATSQPATTDTLANDPEAILNALDKLPHSPVIPPTQFSDDAALPGGSDVEDSPYRIRAQGLPIINRVGRIVPEGVWWKFIFESDGDPPGEQPVRLLPCRELEWMENASNNGKRAVKFLISGELTEYHGRNYLLLRKVLVDQNLNQF